MRLRFLLTVLAAGLAGVASAADDAESDLAAKDLVKIAKGVEPSVVIAEITLKFDKGQAPQVVGGGGYYGADTLIRQERPMEISGVLLEPRKAVFPDPMIHPRFVKEVAVRFGDQTVKAAPFAYGKDYNGLVLELSEPLKKAKPLAFDAQAEGPFYAVFHGRRDGVWTTGVTPVSLSVSVTERGRQFVRAPDDALIVNKDGQAVGMSLNNELPVDESWKGSPLKWDLIDQKEMEKRLAATEKQASSAVMRVKLNFRSPKKTEEQYFRDEGEATEANVLGLVTGPKRLLVLAGMKPNVTARLERITVYPPKGDPVEGKFTHTLTDYGAFVAELGKPMTGALALSDKDVLDFHDTLLIGADVQLVGETLEQYYIRNRIDGYMIGWKKHIYPSAMSRNDRTFLFDHNGRLLALPIARREKVSVERQWSRDEVLLTAAGDLTGVLADVAKHADPSNVPLTEEEESRLAWMGVELQALNPELAKVNKVSHLTNNGGTGGLVSYIYPGSPADKAGVKLGDILIRLHVEGHPKPLEVNVDRYTWSERPFPWEQLDDLPEQYYDRIPRPWPPAENNLSRSLTDLGFAKNYQAEFARDGETYRKDFTVVQSPLHFDTAPKYKSAELGITVRDITYEVQRYFQRTDKDPGVVVSKLEPGSKASVAGIKPYEIITHVNDQPVANVQDFEKLIKDRKDLRLSVKRMLKGRLVTIATDGGAGARQPTTQPDEE